MTDDNKTMPSGIKVAGTISATFSAEVVIPKKKNPKTIVLGNIIIIPEIFSFARSAIKASRVIKKPPTKNETNNCNANVKVIFLLSFYTL